MPTEGAFPLSFTLNSIGPMARSVADCAKADAVMAGEDAVALEPAPLAGLRVGIAQGAPLDRLDDTVGKRFPAALDRAGKGRRPAVGAKSCRCSTTWTRSIARGGMLPAEAFAIHRDRLGAPRRRRSIRMCACGIERARDITAADYIDMMRERAALIRAMDARLADLDVLAMPTTPIVAPRIAEVADADDLRRAQRAAAAQHHDRQFLRSAARSRCRCRATAGCRPG